MKGRKKVGSLQYARAKKQLDRFAEDDPSEGDEKAFDALLTSMVPVTANSKRPNIT